MVAYRASPVTAWLLRKSGLVRIERFSLPNLLADGELVQEFIQEQVKPADMGEALERLLLDEHARAEMLSQFAELATLLRRDADVAAAATVGQLLEENRALNQSAG